MSSINVIASITFKLCWGSNKAVLLGTLLQLLPIKRTFTKAKRPTDSRLISIAKQLLLPQEFTSKSFLSLKHVLNKYR